MNFDSYQKFVSSSVIYAKKYKILYPCLGLAGESGETLDKIKKIYRDKKGKFSEKDIEEITKELGDTLFYLTCIANDLNISLKKIAEINRDKGLSRLKRNKIGGSGDNR